MMTFPTAGPPLPPMRIVSWNIENLTPWLDGTRGDPVGLCRQLGDPDVLCLQEVRLRPQDTALVGCMHAALPDYDCHASLNHDRLNGSFRGGRAYGVATYVRRRLRATALTYPWDREGRIVVSGLPDQRLAIINVYAVNGTARPYRDPDSGVIRGDRHGFKQRFIAQLGASMAALRTEGLELLAIGDWNVSRSRLDTWPRLRTEEPHATARHRFNHEFIDGLGLVDLFRERHPRVRAYTWFNRRARGGRLDAARVDFVLPGKALSDRVVDLGIMADPASRPGSDHAPLWLELAD